MLSAWGKRFPHGRSRFCRTAAWGWDREAVLACVPRARQGLGALVVGVLVAVVKAQPQAESVCSVCWVTQVPFIRLLAWLLSSLSGGADASPPNT